MVRAASAWVMVCTALCCRLCAARRCTFAFTARTLPTLYKPLISSGLDMFAIVRAIYRVGARRTASPKRRVQCKCEMYQERVRVGGGGGSGEGGEEIVAVNGD